MALRGPSTFVYDGDWRHDAACKDHDTNLFFPERGDILDEARQVCAGCPVRTLCLEQGLENREYGVWGGTSERERLAILRERRREGRLTKRIRPRAACGTESGYKWHLNNGGAGTACQECRDAKYRASRRRDERTDPTYRDQCGTHNGYIAHIRAIPKERACQPCITAHAIYQARNKKQQAS